MLGWHSEARVDAIDDRDDDRDLNFFRGGPSERDSPHGIESRESSVLRVLGVLIGGRGEVDRIDLSGVAGRLSGWPEKPRAEDTELSLRWLSRVCGGGSRGGGTQSSS